MNDGDNKEYKPDDIKVLYHSFLFFLCNCNQNKDVLNIINGLDGIKMENAINKKKSADFNIHGTARISLSEDAKAIAINHKNTNEKQGIYDEVLIYLDKGKIMVCKGSRNSSQKRGSYTFKYTVNANVVKEIIDGEDQLDNNGKKDLKNNSNLNKNNIGNGINNNKKEEQVVENSKWKQSDLSKLYSAMIDNKNALITGNGGHKPYELTCESASKICNYRISNFTFVNEYYNITQISKTIKIPADENINYVISSNKKRIYINNSKTKECLGIINVETKEQHVFSIYTTGVMIGVWIDTDKMKDIKAPNDKEDNIQYFLNHKYSDDKNLDNSKSNKNINNNNIEIVNENNNKLFINNFNFSQNNPFKDEKKNNSINIQGKNYKNIQDNLLLNSRVDMFEEHKHITINDNNKLNNNNANNNNNYQDDNNIENNINNHNEKENVQDNNVEHENKDSSNLISEIDYNIFNSNMSDGNIKKISNNNPLINGSKKNFSAQSENKSHNSLFDNLDKNESNSVYSGGKHEDFDLGSSKSNNGKDVNKQENKNNNNNPEMINENINDDKQVSINSQNPLNNMNENNNLFNQDIDRQDNIHNNNEIIFNKNLQQNGFIDTNINFNQKINNSNNQIQFPENINAELIYEQQVKSSNNSDRCWNNLKWLDCCGLCRD